MSVRILGLFFVVTGCLQLGGCCATGAKTVVQDDSPLYFDSAQQAVEKTTELLKKEDWPTLARYYDLAGTKERPALLRSGDFFVRKEKPANHHPGLPWKYRHPFTPGYKFESVADTDAKDVVRVTVAISIDQGGGPPQRSVSTFDMRKSAKGYQILP